MAETNGMVLRKQQGAKCRDTRKALTNLKKVVAEQKPQWTRGRKQEYMGLCCHGKNQTAAKKEA